MFRLRYGLDYIYHWFSSNSRHGVHSPFVYRLVDEVIYNFRAQTGKSVRYVRSEKSNRLIVRLIDFFKPASIKYCNDFEEDTDAADFVIIPLGAYTPAIFNRLLKQVHPGTILILEGIYLNREMKRDWKEIKSHPQVSVSIDLFDIGLVFFRAGQAKEDFKIRF